MESINRDLNCDLDCEDFPQWMYDWFINTWTNTPLPWEGKEVIDLTIDDPDANLKNDLDIEAEELRLEREEEANEIKRYFEQGSFLTRNYFQCTLDLYDSFEDEEEDHIELQIDYQSKYNREE